MKHTIIFANGELQDPVVVRKFAGSADTLIAADGGLTHILSLDLKPDLLIGDLDSVTPEEVARAEALGCEVSRFPAEKNETDLELALLTAVEMRCGKITVVAALGGRTDQTLANIYLLNLPQLKGIDVRLDDGKEEVFLIHGWGEIHGKPGDGVSLLSLSPAIKGVTTTNLRYPLVDEKLVFYHSRGVSNVMQTWKAKIEIESGILLCIHERKGGMP